VPLSAKFVRWIASREDRGAAAAGEVVFAHSPYAALKSKNGEFAGASAFDEGARKKKRKTADAYVYSPVGPTPALGGTAPRKSMEAE